MRLNKYGQRVKVKKRELKIGQIRTVAMRLIMTIFVTDGVGLIGSILVLDVHK